MKEIIAKADSNNVSDICDYSNGEITFKTGLNIRIFEDRLEYLRRFV